MTSLNDNTSYSTNLILSGTDDLRPKYLFCVLCLSVYFLIIFLNFTLLMSILLEKSLHEPMYFFLCNLCLNEIYGTTAFYPKLIYALLSASNIISYVECFTQSLVIYTSFICEYTTLVIMAYDRYVAICRPLQYHNIMANRTVIKAILYSWGFPFIAMLPFTVLASQLKLCGSNIERLYCDIWSIFKLSCTHTTFNGGYGIIMIVVFMGHAVFVVYSYCRLIVACNRSYDNRKKFLQTCVPHLLSLFNFTLGVLFDTTFSRYGTTDFDSHLLNAVQAEILVVPPLFNPLMYGLKLSAVRKIIFHKFTLLKVTILTFCGYCHQKLRFI